MANIVFNNVVKMPTVVHPKTMMDVQESVKTFSFECLNFFSALNELAFNEFVHVQNEIRVKKYFRQMLKKNCNECFKEFKRLVNEPVEYMEKENIDLYYGFVDNCSDDLNVNVEKIRVAMRDFLQKKGVVEYELWADLEVTRLLIAESNLAFHQIAEQQTQRCGKDIGMMFWFFNPAKALRLFKLVRQGIMDRQDIVVNPNECKAIKKAYQSLARKLRNRHFAERSLNKAKKEHPEGHTDKVALN